MKREDSKPAAPKITKKISYKNVSDSCLAQFQAVETKDFWGNICPKPSRSEGDLEHGIIPLHPRLQQQLEPPEPEELLFNRVVSDNVLLKAKNMSASVKKIFDQKPKSNSDTILALPQVRELLLEEMGSRKRPEESYTKGGVKKSKIRMSIRDLVQDKFYDGQIMKRIPAGLLIDIGAECLGLLRWRSVKLVPKKLQKVGGFLGNLMITKLDEEANRFTLKLQTIGFDHDTLEETKYQDVYGYVHSWSQLPGAPEYQRIAPAKAQEKKVPKPPVPQLRTLMRRGKFGPRGA